MSDFAPTADRRAVLLDAFPLPARNSVLSQGAMVAAGSLLLILSAKIHVPFYPVPMTLETFATLVLGFALDSRLAALSVILWLVEGAAGFPVFASTPEKGIGLAYMAGPTGGYLAGFVIAAFVAGWLAERGWSKGVGRTAAAMLVANALIYVPGLLWLGTLLGWDKPILAWGLTPFLLGDLVKLALAAALLPAAWSLIGRARG